MLVLATVLTLAGPPPGRPAARARWAAPTIVGTVGQYRIRGTNRADVIVGLAGRDIIRGRGRTRPDLREQRPG